MDATVSREGNVPTTRFTVDHLAPERRYEVWRDSMACIFDVDAPRAIRQDKAFHATVDAHLIGPLLIGRVTTRRQIFDRSSFTIARDGMDHYMIQLYESGRQRCDYRGGSVEMPANGLLVYDLSQEVHAQTEDFTNISLVIPRSMLEPALRSADDQHMRALSGSEPLVAVLREHMRTVMSQADRFNLRQAMKLAPVTVGLVAACFNASIRDTPGGQAAVEKVMLSAIKREVEARLDDPDLTPAELGRRFHLSRTKLYDLFEPLGGVSRYIRERRLRRALLILRDPTQAHRPIGGIAHDSGFRSESDFSRAFRKRYGMSPRAARHGAVPAEQMATGAGTSLDRRYERWLWDLAP
ncbi:helix-turn-helix domain-containing protein [Rhodospirillaceae bacterium SYSU D60014]|uniref:helix-turn-helix domain-containing protein n=1 Tax=Virgifigura deserti TaxID=2268457 RepID=UPI000E66438C